VVDFAGAETLAEEEKSGEAGLQLGKTAKHGLHPLYDFSNLTVDEVRATNRNAQHNCPVRA
jgi:hypothetical protein